MDSSIETSFSKSLGADISLSVIDFDSDKHLAGKQALAATKYCDGGHTSISHSGNLAAAVSTPINENICGIGIDFETKRELNIKLSKMFLSTPEINALEDPTSEELLELWTIKEAIFKCTPDNNGLFLRNFEIAQRHDGSGNAVCLSRPELKYHFVSTKVPNGTLSVALCLLAPGKK